jgi:hypothetical protein
MSTVIVSCHVNDFYISLQHQSFKRFCKDPYEFIVFNDAKDNPDLVTFGEVFANKVQKTCESLGIQHVRIPQHLHANRSLVFPVAYTEKDDHYVSRCALASQFSMNYVRREFPHAKFFVLIDSDMIMVKPFSVSEFLGDDAMAGVNQSRGHLEYFWNGLFLCNLHSCEKLETFSWEAGKVEGVSVDVGGHNALYLRDTSTRFKNILCEHFTEPQGLPLMEAFANIDTDMKPTPCYLNKELLLDRCIVHIRGGGNWSYMKRGYLEACCAVLQEFLDKN